MATEPLESFGSFQNFI